MAQWTRCLNCQGNGTIQKEVSPGKWETQTCRACGGSGKVNTGMI